MTYQKATREYLNSQKSLGMLKVALQIMGRKFYKNTKKSSLYSQGF